MKTRETCVQYREPAMYWEPFIWLIGIVHFRSIKKSINRIIPSPRPNLDLSLLWHCGFCLYLCFSLHKENVNLSCAALKSKGLLFGA